MESSKLSWLRTAAIVLALMPAASAQTAKSADPQSGITHEQADQILQELRQIRQLLSGNAAPAAPAQPAPRRNAKVDIAGLSILGSKDAPLTMIEFSDYQCPYCRAFHSGTYQEIKKNWIDTGKLRFVSWDLPLEFHSNAAQAALAARCAGEQEKFWEMRALLITNAAKLEPDAVLAYARQVPQLDFDRFKSCIKADKYSADIRNAASVANRQGVSGTPSFLVGKSSGSVIEGSILVGAQPFSNFEQEFREQLAR